MSLAEKLSTIANNTPLVYNAGYEKGKSESGGGSGEEFVGIKYSDFDSDNMPQVADARGLNTNVDAYNKVWLTYQMFSTGYGAGLNARLKTVYLPSGLTYLAYGTFALNYTIERVLGDLTTLIQISDTVFQNCKCLKEFPYMPNLNAISNNSFANCVGLEEVKLYKKAEISTSAFNGCTNIKDIYVPWSEGEVANSPWGAVNSTIHYNTTYDENHNPIV